MNDQPSHKETAPPPQHRDGTSNVPVPDPTTLTTQQLYRESTGLRDILETRLAAMDKALGLLQNAANKSPSIGEVFLGLGSLAAPSFKGTHRYGYRPPVES